MKRRWFNQEDFWRFILYTKVEGFIVNQHKKCRASVEEKKKILKSLKNREAWRLENFCYCTSSCFVSKKFLAFVVQLCLPRRLPLGTFWYKDCCAWVPWCVCVCVCVHVHVRVCACACARGRLTVSFTSSYLAWELITRRWVVNICWVDECMVGFNTLVKIETIWYPWIHCFLIIWCEEAFLMNAIFVLNLYV